MIKSFRRILFAALILGFTIFSSAASLTDVVFVDGSSMASASAELSAAFVQLAATGGTIVLRGPVPIARDFVAPAHRAPVTLTSRHGGHDYLRERGAKLVLNGDFTLNGPTSFARLDIASSTKDGCIQCGNHAVVFARDVLCEPSGRNRFPSLVGANVTINGGQWHSVIGGSSEAGDPAGTLRITINSGQFDDTVCATGLGGHAGDAELTLNGGCFYGGVAGVGESAGATVHGNISITINGGTYWNTIAASRHAQSVFTGTYRLAINGGDFTALTAVTGTGALPGGATSRLIAAPTLLDAENHGTMTFTNPLIKGADPWVFQHDGFYYCTTTGFDRLVGRKVANLADLPHAEPVTFFKPAAGRAYSRHLWSPKIYRFNARDFGGGNAGWYLYFTANDGRGRSAVGHRLFVLKARTDDPIGPYGSPQDGTPDTPCRVTSANGRVFNDEWVAGPKVLHYHGKNYLIWVGRVGGPESKHTGDHWQCLYIDELLSPWTVAGRAAMICRPTLAWEKHGAGMTGAGYQRRMLPEVVEGGTPVITDDGTLYLLYAGSGYWTPYYAIGLMKLVGDDPMNPAHWQKAPQPIFKASDAVVGSANA
jgi:GH43 family beta-xylosidase